MLDYRRLPDTSFRATLFLHCSYDAGRLEATDTQATGLTSFCNAVMMLDYRRLPDRQATGLSSFCNAVMMLDYRRLPDTKATGHPSFCTEFIMLDYQRLPDTLASGLSSFMHCSYDAGLPEATRHLLNAH